MIEGLSHLTLVVRDLEAMTRICVEGLGAVEVYSSLDQTFSISKEKFFLIGGMWIAVMEGDPLPSRSYNHIAFKISEHDFEVYEERIRALGLEISAARSRVSGEGRSIYFYDHDNHLFELHTGTLEERLARYGLGREAAE
ncbi:FosX/FosE/FosI family fosfomycin resistance hydrolase [Candidatus Raskinella chloraquaticus]|jgi:fosfomycin resistance protein FosX|uniref:FosX/FosE/FosI family fosfomycin resistance thiol transferase n=1 Tax=Candidatus Raskinella chloraquaticus TaxID=1951219 RepID=A0A1W9HV64_9HYPH|nr:MAG: FosX/FosE/FosI family fosfomycin resistance thiol transferase [Proteobacteria bacterium SG_bin8]